MDGRLQRESDWEAQSRTSCTPTESQPGKESRIPKSTESLSKTTKKEISCRTQVTKSCSTAPAREISAWRGSGYETGRCLTSGCPIPTDATSGVCADHRRNLRVTNTTQSFGNAHSGAGMAADGQGFV